VQEARTRVVGGDGGRGCHGRDTRGDVCIELCGGDSWHELLADINVSKYTGAGGARLAVGATRSAAIVIYKQLTRLESAIEYRIQLGQPGIFFEYLLSLPCKYSKS
jgi:hypothetical protein